MPWTKAARIQYQRSGLRYTSDLTDAEWALIARMMPPRRRLGRPREVNLREIVQAIFYILSSGCQWRALPKEFPPYSTVQGYFYAWRDTGRWQQIVEALVRKARRRLGRKPKPTAAVIDSQTASTTEAGGPRGFDAGKRLHGRKRHIVTDTNGLLLAAYVHPANIQDVHGAVPLLESLRGRFQSLNMSSPIGFIAANNSSTHSRTAGRGQSRSSSDRPGSKASSSCPGAGSSSAPLHGSEDVGASPKTSKALPPPSSPGYSLPI